MSSGVVGNGIGVVGNGIGVGGNRVNREVLGNRDGSWVGIGGSGPKARIFCLFDWLLMHFHLSGRALLIGKGVKKHANFWRMRRAISFDCTNNHLILFA